MTIFLTLTPRWRGAAVFGRNRLGGETFLNFVAAR